MTRARMLLPGKELGPLLPERHTENWGPWEGPSAGRSGHYLTASATSRLESPSSFSTLVLTSSLNPPESNQADSGGLAQLHATLPSLKGCVSVLFLRHRAPLAVHSSDGHTSWRLRPGLQHELWEPRYVSHSRCLPQSVLTGSWRQS